MIKLESYLHSRSIPHTSGELWVSFVSFTRENDRDTSRAHCMKLIGGHPASGVVFTSSLIFSCKNMMTSSNGNKWKRHQMETGHLCGKFPAQRPVTRSFDVFFDLRLNKRLSKQSWGWWFETLSRPFWRHRNDIIFISGKFISLSFVFTLKIFLCIFKTQYPQLT